MDIGNYYLEINNIIGKGGSAKIVSVKNHPELVAKIFDSNNIISVMNFILI